jgi:micrococcal nuclease
MMIYFYQLFVTLVLWLAYSGANAEYYKVQRVVDGDTVVIEGIGTVRLIGLDTPETVHPQKPVEYFGKEASDYLKNFIGNKKVRLEYDVLKKDRYNRTLAYIFLEDGTLVNAEMIKRGYGHVYTNFPFKRIEEFRRLGRESREQYRGLWAKKNTVPAAVQYEKPPNKQTAAETAKEKTVYATKTGKKYHVNHCRHLQHNKIPITLTDARHSGLSPCNVCKPD